MAGDGKMLLTGVSKYVVRALVISMSLVLFRICETAAIARWASNLEVTGSSLSKRGYIFSWGGGRKGEIVKLLLIVNSRFW